MFQPNVEKLLALLGPDDLVLDVGGWACPFNRAQWIIDAEPYETRGYYRTFGGPAAQGGEREWFSAATWVQRDICERTPWPFADRQFDFAICSHTLEDVRDPLWVCAELMRVAKRGYLEVPSREWESCRGVEMRGMVGMSHHRWLVEIDGGSVRFVPKYHVIHSHWRYSLPYSHLRALPPERTVAWLWWEGRFDCRETVTHGTHNQARELEQYVESVRPYRPWQLQVDALQRRFLPLERIRNRLLRLT